jgi:LmbE family N-acetylglucosaminyl deacetylase
MKKKIPFILFTLLLYYPLLWAQGVGATQAPPIRNLEPIKKTDRILILAPHPDDETIGCAGIIQQAVKAGADIHIIYLTNGDHNQFAFIVYEKRITFRKSEFIHMGQVRRKEAVMAMKLLGLEEKRLIFLGYPDFGTFAIFNQYWQEAKPFRSLLTRISRVPYKENLSFGAPYKGESILADLKKILLAYKPNKIFVSHPADVNVDHKTFYLFLQVALADLSRQMPQPKIYPYLIHCTGWPLPRHYHPELSLVPPKQFSDSQAQWSQYRLSKESLEKKYQAILCYKSQTRSSAFYLFSFARQNELFGDYPEIDLIPQQRDIALKAQKQVESQDRALSFFGASSMFTDSGTGLLKNLDNLIETKGQVSYGLLGDSLLVRIDKTKRLNRRFSTLLYLFGYSRKTPFAQMPKMRIFTKHKRFKVFVGKKRVKAEGINLEINDRVLILEIPLKILGEPDYILTSVKTYAGTLPIDAISFRKINIR